VDDKRILKGFGMFWVPSLSGAGMLFEHDDVSPYFIRICANLTDNHENRLDGNAPGFLDDVVISVKHPGKHVGAP